MTTRAPYPQQSPGDGHGQGGGPAGPGGGPGRPGPSRARKLIPPGLAVWALLEIWLLILVGQAAGGLAVLVLLVAGFLIGSAVIKRAGRRAWQRLAETVQQAQQAQQAQSGQPGAQARERGGQGSGGNALGMLGGLLLMVPGLLSDVAGLLCLFPPTAALLRRGTRRYLGHSTGEGSLGDAYRQAREAEEQMRIHRPDGKVVEGEVIEGEVVRDDAAPGSRPPHGEGPADR